ncbi:MAG: hypothetical protein AB7V50_09330, partial [Vampirovibrionia bacterium]
KPEPRIDTPEIQKLSDAEKKCIESKEFMRNLAAFFVAMTCYVLYAGIGVIKFSKRIVKSLDEKKTKEGNQTPPASAKLNNTDKKTQVPFQTSISSSFNFNNQDKKTAEKTNIFKDFETKIMV